MARFNLASKIGALSTFRLPPIMTTKGRAPTTRLSTIGFPFPVLAKGSASAARLSASGIPLPTRTLLLDPALHARNGLRRYLHGVQDGLTLFLFNNKLPELLLPEIRTHYAS